tara:strand:+ start:4397 stop:5203 length:807 start_codon:yes stop_codon:yes gene_type:complete
MRLQNKNLRLVAIAMCKNEEAILEKWLQRTSEFSDGIIVIDDGSTDNSFKMLKANKKVKHIIKHEPGGPMEARKSRNKLFDAVREFGGEWTIILDIDEIMDIRLADHLDNLLNNPRVGQIYFKEISLWRNNKQYRIDKPDMYNRQRTMCQILRMNKNLKWVPSYPYTLKHRLRMLLQKGKYLPVPPNGYMKLRGLVGETLDLSELVKIHYHFADWEKVWWTHLRYAVRESIQLKKNLKDVPEIVDWATLRLNEEGLELAPVKPEWGVL